MKPGELVMKFSDPKVLHSYELQSEGRLGLESQITLKDLVAMAVFTTIIAIDNANPDVDGPEPTSIADYAYTAAEAFLRVRERFQG
jgi:hypothetical protein